MKKTYLDFPLLDEKKQIIIYKKVCNRKKISIAELNDARKIGKVRLLDRVKRRFKKNTKVLLSYFSWRCYIESILKDRIGEIKEEIKSNDKIKGGTFKEKNYIFQYEKYLNDRKRFTDTHIDSFPSVLMFAYGGLISLIITVASMIYSERLNKLHEIQKSLIGPLPTEYLNMNIGYFYINGLFTLLIITVVVIIALIKEKQKEKRNSSFYEDLITIVHDLADESEDIK